MQQNVFLGVFNSPSQSNYSYFFLCEFLAPYAYLTSISDELDTMYWHSRSDKQADSRREAERRSESIASISNSVTSESKQ